MRLGCGYNHLFWEGIQAIKMGLGSYAPPPIHDWTPTAFLFNKKRFFYFAVDSVPSAAIRSGEFGKSSFES